MMIPGSGAAAPHSTLSLPYMYQGVKMLFPLTKNIGIERFLVISILAPIMYLDYKLKEICTGK